MTTKNYSHLSGPRVGTPENQVAVSRARPMTYAEIHSRAATAGRELERRLLGEALEANSYNITTAAAALSCPWSTLRRALDRHPGLLEKCRGKGRPRGVKGAKSAP